MPHYAQAFCSAFCFLTSCTSSAVSLARLRAITPGRGGRCSLRLLSLALEGFPVPTFWFCRLYFVLQGFPTASREVYLPLLILLPPDKTRAKKERTRKRRNVCFERLGPPLAYSLFLPQPFIDVSREVIDHIVGHVAWRAPSQM